MRQCTNSCPLRLTSSYGGRVIGEGGRGGGGVNAGEGEEGMAEGMGAGGERGLTGSVGGLSYPTCGVLCMGLAQLTTTN